MLQKNEIIVLPELMVGPIRYPIGKAFWVLGKSESVEITDVEEIQISPRIKEKCLTLSNGEKVLVTDRSKLLRPRGIEGVLGLRNDSLFWLSHRRLEAAAEEIEQSGLKGVSLNRTASWRNKFSYRSEQLTDEGELEPGNEGLRPPQLGALFAIGAHWSLYHKPATIVMPTGTGKTETMLSVLAAYSPGSMLVTVPTKALRNQTARKFMTFGLLRDLSVVPNEIENPIVGVVTKRPKSKEDLAIFEDCNVVVGTMSSLSGGTATSLANDVANNCSALLVDEAHHIAAKTWTDFRDAFSDKKVLQFTATPFRADGKLVDGDVVFSYSLKAAQQDKYFKPIKFEPVHELTIEKSDQAIADTAISQLRLDLESDLNHLLMARCVSIARAETILEYYKDRAADLNPILIHSELKDADKRVEDLKSGASRIAVCVDMLGEGFDLPELKVAAVHDPHKSLAVLLQFIGRFTRSSGSKIGDATVIANIADPDVSLALERLYSEDSDWNYLLSEMSSTASKDHQELVDFLNNSVAIESDSDLELGISHHLLRPTKSTLFYRAKTFTPKKFIEGLPPAFAVAKVWINEDSNTLFFVTHSRGRVKWSRSKELVDTDWNLFVIQFDREKELIYLNSTEKGTNFDALAKATGASEQIYGEPIFRCLSGIGRLVFQNLGVSKHGRRNLSYAMYTGSDVREALSLAERAGSRKSNLNGGGWEFGRQMTIGCSHKGRVWSRDVGTIPQFIEWASNVGTKILDDTISTEKIIENVLIPEEVKSLPDLAVLGIEWPVELLKYAEERVTLSAGALSNEFFLLDISIDSVDYSNNIIEFSITNTSTESLGRFELKVGGTNGFEIRQLSGDEVVLSVGNKEMPIATFFCDFPPLVRFVDLTELDGNLLLKPQNTSELALDPNRFENWDWTGVDITKESLWKDGELREDSIQWKVGQTYVASGCPIVFDDDGANEAADLVCIQEENDHIKLVLIHCKFSGSTIAGKRVNDVVEVCSQAVRSTKWAGRFKELCKHIQNRNEKRRTTERNSHFLNGSGRDVTNVSKASRFKEVRPEIVIVQPGLSASKLTTEQSSVLAATTAYIKQTINVDLDIICSE